MSTRTPHRRQSPLHVACPRCGAAPQQDCVGTNDRPRENSHADRWRAGWTGVAIIDEGEKHDRTARRI